MREIKIKLFPAQTAFLQSKALFRGLIGGRGSGKTYAGAADMFIQSMQTPALRGIYAPTFSDLSRFTVRTFRQIAGDAVTRFVSSPVPTLYLSSGSEIICGSLDNPEAGRGPSFKDVWIDEGSLICRDAFINVLGSLRSDGKMGRLTCTFTPRGLQHWTAEVFNNAKRKDVECFHATTKQNPFLPSQFYDAIRSQITAAFAEQELEGKFISMSGQLIHRDWFKIVDAAPDCGVMQCRFWDLAATEQKKGNDPDFTAGALVGFKDGIWYILDMRHDRLSPMGVEELVAHTATIDSRQITIRMEEEGGASGKSIIDHYARRVLPGYDFAGIHPSGDKVARAMPFMAAAEQGNICLVRGSWNSAFLDEAESFGPDAQHDDMVDAASAALNYIAEQFAIGLRPVDNERGFEFEDQMRLAESDAEILAMIEKLPPSEREKRIAEARQAGVNL